MPYQLIIVDDEHEIRTGLANYFPWSELGFEVAAAFEDGSQAAEYLAERPVDVVLTDIRMPQMDGIELARHIFERFPGVVTIFISGHADFSYAKKAMEYGVKFYIVKPTVYQEIFDVFTKVRFELDKASPAENGDGIGAVTYYEQNVSRIKQYVAEHYGTVTLESVAAFIGMNPYYLSSFYRQHTGEKFIDYVIGVKMAKAAAMLRDPNYRIFEVALQVGYKNANNFGRAFKSYYHVSPREYRQNGYKTFEGGAP